MSEHHVEVVTIDKIEAHDNADSLEIAWHAGYPVVVRKGEFRPGDLATYIPVDAVVPEGDEFAAIYQYTKRGRVRATRLRGALSMGLLWRVPEGAALGDDVADILGITKYEPPLVLGNVTGDHGEGMAEPPWFLRYTDIEGYRRYPDILNPGEEVIITEKLHGANARFSWWDGAFWVGSRRQALDPAGSNAWSALARRLRLEDKLRWLRGLVLFGELLGVQDLRYGLPPGQLDFRLFDIYDLEASRYLDHADLELYSRYLDLPLVPVLHRAPWSPGLLELAEGPSNLAEHVREGIVIRPVAERYDPRLGRVILKYVSESFLLRKER